MNEIMNVNGVECYEKDGTAYLKLETVARGLGFTEVKNGKDYIMWRRVDGFLQDLGFGTCAERPEFIPENIFYRLAMKAKNETAEKFQALVADEIIPSIRRTGSYSAKPQITDKSAEKRADAMLLNAKNKTVAILQSIYNSAGVKPEYQAMAFSDFYSPYGINLPRIALQGTKVTYDKTTIADRLGILSKAGNPHALAVGAIIHRIDVSDEEKEQVPYCRNGHDGVDVQYTESVIGKVQEWLEKEKYPLTIDMGDGRKVTVRYRKDEHYD